jgi:hypothetical protein
MSTSILIDKVLKQAVRMEFIYNHAVELTYTFARGCKCGQCREWEASPDDERHFGPAYGNTIEQAIDNLMDQRDEYARSKKQEDAQS